MDIYTGLAADFITFFRVWFNAGGTGPVSGGGELLPISVTDGNSANANMIVIDAALNLNTTFKKYFTITVIFYNIKLKTI